MDVKDDCIEKVTIASQVSKTWTKSDFFVQQKKIFGQNQNFWAAKVNISVKQSFNR